MSYKYVNENDGGAIIVDGIRLGSRGWTSMRDHFNIVRIIPHILLPFLCGKYYNDIMERGDKSVYLVPGQSWPHPRYRLRTSEKGQIYNNVCILGIAEITRPHFRVIVACDNMSTSHKITFGSLAIIRIPDHENEKDASRFMPSEIEVISQFAAVLSEPRYHGSRFRDFRELTNHFGVSFTQILSMDDFPEDCRRLLCDTPRIAPSRNDPYPCGSGEKNKNCHGRRDVERNPTGKSTLLNASLGQATPPAPPAQSSTKQTTLPAVYCQGMLPAFVKSRTNQGYAFPKIQIRFESGEQACYCIDLEKKGPLVFGEKVHEDEVMTEGMTFLLFHGYPYDNLGLENDDAARYATQAAIWIYQSMLDSHDSRSDDFIQGDDELEIIPTIQRLVKDAQAVDQRRDSPATVVRLPELPSLEATAFSTDQANAKRVVTIILHPPKSTDHKTKTIDSEVKAPRHLRSTNPTTAASSNEFTTSSTNCYEKRPYTSHSTPKTDKPVDSEGSRDVGDIIPREDNVPNESARLAKQEVSCKSTPERKCMQVISDGVLKAFIGTGEYRFTKLSLDDGTIAYCFELGRNWPETGMTATVDAVASPGLCYILRAGYPNKKIFDNGDLDRYITQAAVWLFQYKMHGGPSVSDDFLNGKEAYTGIHNEIDKLVNTAISIEKRRIVSPYNLTELEARIYSTNDESVQRIVALSEVGQQSQSFVCP